MEVICSSETSVDINGLHGVISQKIVLFKKNLDENNLSPCNILTWYAQNLKHKCYHTETLNANRIDNGRGIFCKSASEGRNLNSVTCGIRIL
jgi:hypothetical protein